MKKRPNYEEFKKRVLQDPEAKAAYDLLEPEFALLRQFIKARKKAKLKILKKQNDIGSNIRSHYE